MRCDEVQERIVELLYKEIGTPPASEELQAHVRTCPSCSAELEELELLRSTLRVWKDEPPPRSVSIAVPPARVAPLRPRFSGLRLARVAAVAAAAFLVFLALANAEITWNKDGFAFRTRLLPETGVAADPANYYTKAEVRDIIKRVTADSESAMSDLSYQMMLRVLDTIEQERRVDMQFLNSRAVHSGSRN